MAHTSAYGDVATVEFGYQEGARMWFTTVQSHVAGAAAIEAAFGGDDTLFLRAGGVHAELFPVGEPAWETFRQIVAAVLAGRFSEVGNPEDATGQVIGPNGTRTFGAARILYLTRWQHARKYLPYGARD